MSNVLTLLTVALAMIDPWADMDILEGLVRPYESVVGIPMATVLFFGATGVAFYIVQRKAIIPGIMLLMIGGVALTSAPSQVLRVSTIVVMLMIVTIGYLLYNQVR